MKTRNLSGLMLALFALSALSFFSFNSAAPKATQSTEGKSAVHWMSFEEAVAKLKADKAAGRKGKKIFIDVYTDWCGWCKRMDALTFQQPHIATYLNENFYPVKFNAEQKEDIQFANKTFSFVNQGRRGYHQLAAALLEGKMSYPTVVFLNEDIELLQRVPGFLDAKLFDTILHYLAEDHYKTTPWEAYKNAFATRE